jgi:hypothetical protein
MCDDRSVDQKRPNPLHLVPFKQRVKRLEQGTLVHDQGEWLAVSD